MNMWCVAGYWLLATGYTVHCTYLSTSTLTFFYSLACCSARPPSLSFHHATNIMWRRIYIVAKCRRSSSTAAVQRAFTQTAGVHSDNCNVLLRHDDENTGVTTLTLNKPEKYNVLTWAMLEALQNQLDTIAKEEVRLPIELLFAFTCSIAHHICTLISIAFIQSVRVLVIGASGKAFCSGHDLREVQTNTTQLFKLCGETMSKIVRLPQPVIAMVQGLATAAGCQLVASCDLSVASDVSRHKHHSV